MKKSIIIGIIIAIAVILCSIILFVFVGEDCSSTENNHSIHREKTDFSEEILGVWEIQYAKIMVDGEAVEDYSLQNMYGTGIKYGGKLTFNEDGTFKRYVGIHTYETENYEGTYTIEGKKIKMQYYNGTEATAEYLPESKEIVFYVTDFEENTIGEFYSK